MTIVSRQETLRRIEECEVMPSIPQVILRVKEISEDPRSSVADLANVILSDHTLTSKILKIANSAFYAEYASKVSTVTQAITLMGFRTVQNVVISLALYDSVKAMGEHHKFDFRSFWTHSLSTGVIGKMLATAARYKTPEEAFIAGFMHNIGTAIMAVIFPEEYDVVMKRITSGDEPITAERSVFGVDHTEVGGWLAKKWNLPPMLTRPITDHHRLRLPSKQRSNIMLIDIVFVSDLSYDYVFLESTRNEETKRVLYSGAHDLLGLSEAMVDKVLELVPEMICDIASDLDISLKIPGKHIEATVTAAPEKQEALEMAEKLTERTRQLAVMLEAGEAIRSADNEDEVIQTALEEIIRGMGIGRAIVLRIDDDAKTARGILGFGVNSQQSVYEMSLPITQGIIAATIANRSIENVLDVENQIYAEIMSEEERKLLGVRSFAMLPLEISGKVDMVMVLNNPDDSDPVDDERLRSIAGLISQAAVAIENLRLRKQIAELRGNEVKNLINTAFK